MPLPLAAAGANRHDAPLPQEITVHPDWGYDSGVTCTLPDGLDLVGLIARRGVLAPLQAGSRRLK